MLLYRGLCSNTHQSLYKILKKKIYQPRIITKALPWERFHLADTTACGRSSLHINSVKNILKSQQNY